MATSDLPGRTDPDILREVCYVLVQSGSKGIDGLSDELGIDVRRMRETVTYGAKLGLLTGAGDQVESNFGTAIADSEGAGEIAFKRGLERYEPYREALTRLYGEDRMTSVLGEPCITKEDVSLVLGRIVDGDVSERESLLFMKTVDAAGCGTFVHGRKGYRTRIRLADEFHSFAQWLSEVRSSDETRDDRRGNRPGRGECENEASNNEVTVTIEVEMTGKSNEELIELIRELTADVDGE